MARFLRSAGEGDDNAPVLSTLAFDFRHLDPADFGGAAHMGPAAGLQIDAGNLKETNAALSDRRLHRHGADELGTRRELLVADPAGSDGMVAGDELVEPRRDRVLLERGARHVEIEPTLAIGDLPAGD